MDAIKDMLGMKKKKDPKSVVKGKINAKQKREKRTLGLTEKQQDYIFFILLTIAAAVYAYYKVDWEYTIWPRSLGDVCELTPADVKHTTSFDIFLTPNTSTSWNLWRDAIKQEKLEDKQVSLVLFHSELVDFGGSQLLSRADGYKPAEQPNVLNFVVDGTVDRIVWVKPPWSKHFWGSNLTTSQQFFAGKGADGVIRTTCDDDYFVFNKIYAPKEDLTNPVPFHLQVLPLTDMYRRATVVPVSPAYIVDMDITYYYKTEPIILQLRAKGMESRESKFLRAWQSGICLDQENAATKMEQYNLIEATIEKVFAKELYTLPKDMFVSRVSNTFPVMCQDKGDIIWSNLWHVLSSLSQDQIDLIKQKGLPSEAGTTAMPSQKQINSMMSEAMTFLTKTGLPPPRILTSATTPELRNLTNLLGSNLHYTFGHIASFHPLSEFDEPEPAEAPAAEAEKKDEKA